MDGISGNIEFYDSGVRRNFQLDVVSVIRVSVKAVIGTWNDTHGLHIFDKGEKHKTEGEDVFKEKPVDVVTIEVR